MQLHRTTGQPDWEAVPTAERNYWQQHAARTNGWLTPANIASVIGLLIVLFGLGELLAKHYVVCIVCLAVGRLTDIVDGWLADRTGTKSPLGERMDATIDKIGVFLAFIVFFIVPVGNGWLVLALLLPQVAATILSLVAVRQGRHLHPSRIGKLTAVAIWSSLVGLLIVAADFSFSHGVFNAAVEGLATVTVLMSIVTVTGYLRDYTKLGVASGRPSSR